MFWNVAKFVGQRVVAKSLQSDLKRTILPRFYFKVMYFQEKIYYLINQDKISQDKSR